MDFKKIGISLLVAAALVLAYFMFSGSPEVAPTADPAASTHDGMTKGEAAPAPSEMPKVEPAPAPAADPAMSTHDGMPKTEPAPAAPTP